MCCLEAFADTPAVTTPLLKFMSEFVFNKSQRLTFDSSSANGILLFREVRGGGAGSRGLLEKGAGAGVEGVEGGEMNGEHKGYGWRALLCTWGCCCQCNTAVWGASFCGGGCVWRAKERSTQGVCL